MQIDFVDTFVTGWAFSGNTAAVVQPAAPLETSMMQRMATQHNLSETIFIRKGEQAGVWQLQTFTPVRETPESNHGVMAAAHVLTRQLGVNHVVFQLASQQLIRVSLTTLGLRLEVPLPVISRIQPPPVLLLSTFPAGVREVHRDQDWLIVYDDPARVFAANPERHTLMRLPERGVIVTAPGLEDCDYVCRYFAPRYGIYEDAVTPYANAVAASFWGERLQKSDLSAYQASTRGGRLLARVSGQGVALIGVCRTYATALVNPDIISQPLSQYG